MEAWARSTRPWSSLNFLLLHWLLCFLHFFNLIKSSIFLFLFLFFLPISNFQFNKTMDSSLKQIKLDLQLLTSLGLTWTPLYSILPYFSTTIFISTILYSRDHSIIDFPLLSFFFFLVFSPGDSSPFHCLNIILISKYCSTLVHEFLNLFYFHLYTLKCYFARRGMITWCQNGSKAKHVISSCRKGA